LPFVYASFQSFGAISRQQLQTVGFKPGAAPPVTRLNEIPAHDSVIVFPGARGEDGTDDGSRSRSQKHAYETVHSHTGP